MQVILSIQAGTVLPSMLLRKLGSHNRKNKLSKAFRELGRVERTLFLLRYISEPDFRTIRAETTKIESYNAFLDWIGFGGTVIKSGDLVEQNKQNKYMNFVANAILLHNVVAMTDIIKNLVAEGHPVTRKHIACLSPFARTGASSKIWSVCSQNGRGTRTPETTYIATDAMIVGRYDNFLHVSCTYPVREAAVRIKVSKTSIYKAFRDQKPN